MTLSPQNEHIKKKTTSILLHFKYIHDHELRKNKDGEFYDKKAHANLDAE